MKFTPDFTRFDSLFELVTYFNSKEKCEKFIIANRWGDDIICPYCGHHHCYTRKDGVTTNTIEGFWGYFKRVVFGTYHFVSTKYLQRYIDESVYRWNTREYSEGTRFATMLSNAIGLCTYEQVKMVA